MKLIKHFALAIPVLLPSALIIGSGCTRNRSMSGADLIAGKPFAAVCVLRDQTPTVQHSQTVIDADLYVGERVHSFYQAAKRLRVAGRVEFYTSPAFGQSLGASRHHMEWSQRIQTPRESARQLTD